MTTATHHTSRRLSVLAWVVGLLAASLFIGLTVLGFVTQPERWGDNSWTLAWIGLPIVGAVIASSRPRHPVGWLMLAIGGSIALGVAGVIYAQGTVEFTQLGPLPGAVWVLWATQALFIPGFSLVPLLLLVFPSGRPPSIRWLWPLRLVVAAQALLVFAYATRVHLELGEGVRVPNPVAFEPIASLMEVMIPPLIIGVVVFSLVAVANLVWRFIRSSGVEREQLKWLVFAAGAVPVLFGIGMLGGHNAFIILAFVGGLNGIAASIGIAVLRYRLYDIDRVISRTVSYAIVTVILGAIFGLIALGPVLVVGSGGSSPDYVIAAATLIVFALFRPVRRRVQAFVDRRFNRSRYDAARLIESFNARLRREVDLDALGAELRDLVAGTMHPSHVSLWVRSPEERRR